MTEDTEATRALQRAADRFVAAAVAVPEACWATRPGGGSWSLAEITEHVAVANTNMAKGLDHLVTLDRAVDIDDEEIPYLFYRGDEPPHVATPTGTWTDRSVALADLDASVQALMDDARFEEADPRTVGRPHPVFGLLDGHQWLLFAAAHTLRHHAQVLGVTVDLRG